MHRATPSSTPADFRLTIAGATVPEVLIDPSARTSTIPRRYSHHFRDVSRWWEDWVPVATTGWGALVLIVPLLIVQFLVYIIGAVSRPRAEEE